MKHKPDHDEKVDGPVKAKEIPDLAKAKVVLTLALIYRKNIMQNLHSNHAGLQRCILCV